MEKIKKELIEITEKYKKDFKVEINSGKVFETILEGTLLIDKYELKLDKELHTTSSEQLKFIDSNDKLVLTEFIRDCLIDFRKFSLELLLL